MNRKVRRGFTLIELMIVVAIIGVLAAVAVPKFAELLRKSNEGATKGNLGALRSGLTIYYADNQGIFPGATWYGSNATILSATLIPKYLDKIPNANTGDYHSPSNNVNNHQTTSNHSHDKEGWIFDGYIWPGSSFYPDQDWGSVWVACSHTDTKASQWFRY